MNSSMVRILRKSTFFWVIQGIITTLGIRNQVLKYYFIIFNFLNNLVRADAEAQIPWAPHDVERWQSEQPLLSVIILCHDYVRYIDETLLSIGKQTWQDIEIIVVVYGLSNISTINTLNQLAHKREGVQVMIRREKGKAEARNFGISRSQGKYICCLDSGNTIEPTYFEKCLCLLETNPGVSFTYPLVKFLGDNCRIRQTEPFDLRLLLKNNHICSGAIFRKDLWKVVGGYDRSLQSFEDWDFWINLGKAGFRGKLIPEHLFNHRKHTDALSKPIEKDGRSLPSQIRKKHLDLVSDPTQINSIEKSYCDYRVPRPFINLSSRNHYLCSGKRLGIVIADWCYFGGAETILYELLWRLKNRKNFDLILITEALKTEMGKKWYRKLFSLSNQIYDLGTFLDEHYWPVFVKNLVATRSPNFVLISNHELSYEWTPQIKAHTTVPIIDILHSPEICIYSVKKFDQFIDCHIAVSEKIRKTLVNKFGGSKEKVHTVYNGVDTTHFNPDIFDRQICLKRLGLDVHMKVISYIGRLSSEKGTPYLPEIFKRILRDKVHFLIVGDGPDREALRKMIRKQNIESHVTIVGYHEDVRSFLSATSILLLPSIVEGFPRIVLESLAMRVPVIASDVGELRSLIKNGWNGYLVKPGDINAFEIRISELLNDEIKAKEFGKRGRQLVSTRYSLENMVNEYSKILDDVIQ